MFYSQLTSHCPGNVAQHREDLKVEPPALQYGFANPSSRSGQQRGSDRRSIKAKNQTGTGDQTSRKTTPQLHVVSRKNHRTPRPKMFPNSKIISLEIVWEREHWFSLPSAQHGHGGDGSCKASEIGRFTQE